MNVVRTNTRKMRTCLHCGTSTQHVLWTSDKGATWVPGRHKAPSGVQCSFDSTSRVPKSTDHWAAPEEIAMRQAQVEAEEKGGKSKKLQPWQKTTVITLAITTALLVVYDLIVAFFNNEPEDTISRRMQILGWSHLAIPYAVGFIFVSHFFWNGAAVMKQPWAFLVGAAIFAGLIGLDVLGVAPKVSPIFAVILGVICGRLFWPLSPL